MSSLIPKINLGTNGKRSKANMSFDSQTTANIGFVQPTMCRMLVPDSSITVQNRTLVRMSPLVNPTFGRLSQRDYFTFVKMTDVYRPWAEFLAGKNFTVGDTSYVPTELPRFSMGELVASLIAHNSYIGFSPFEDVTVPIAANAQFTNSQLNSLLLSLTESINDYGLNQGTAFANVVIVNGQNVELNTSECSVISTFSDGNCEYYFNNGNIAYKFTEKESPTYENSDFTFWVPSGFIEEGQTFSWPDEIQPSVTHTSHLDESGVYVHFRLKPFAKNLRKILIGLGYGFNPFDNELYTPFKILAFYKSWFESFHPTRNIQFTDTDCYKIIKQLESQVTTSQLRTMLFNMILTDWKDAFYYYTAPDYFSASLYNLGDNTLEVQANQIASPLDGNILSYNEGDSHSNVSENGVFETSNGLNGLSYRDRSTGASGYFQSVVANQTNGTASTDGVSLSSRDSINSYFKTSPLIFNLAQKLLRFTNKNNVVGKNIRDFLKTNYGIDEINMDNNAATKVNSNRIDINFDDVMNTAATADAFLGEYAGKGLGYKSSDKTYFSTKDFGFFICMSVIVPESGYFQGSLKENKIYDKFEFFTPAFDALGYDIITRGEIKNDFDTDCSAFNPASFDTAAGFGFIPRYTHFKVGRNIVNGDLTLRSTRDGLKGYYLDKIFPSIQLRTVPKNVPVLGDVKETELDEPDYLPYTVSDNVRKIDADDAVGEYNRIFQYTDVDMDHFIIQKVFDVEVTAPWKSVSDSFDTVNSGEGIISRNHQ